MSVASHLVGGKIQEMIAAHEKGDAAGAAAIHQELLPLFEVLFIAPNPIPVKAALRMVGLPAGPVRLPLVDASDDDAAMIRSVLGELGLNSEANPG